MLVFLLINSIFSGISREDVTLEASRGVINRAVPELDNDKLNLLLIDKVDNKFDVFEISSSNGILTVKGSSGVAICHGFYTYLTRNHFGMITWGGKHINLPDKLPDTEVFRLVSPFEHHYNFNVVTFGYTMPFWDWKRWQEEIDWMALHGLDMPLSYSGTEAIATRVWKKLGLTQDEIDEFYVGPAHLPWQRMGNIVNHDGTVTPKYNEEQIELQHKILNRYRELGIKPICSGFAGFIPKRGILRIYPNVKIYELKWSDFPDKNHATLLSPDEDLFLEIGKRYIEEYENEFGKNDFYIADTFNEMEIPEASDKHELLANMGKRVYESIKLGNPDAVWVIQGWTLGYQRNIWDEDSVKALLSKVPNDKMLILDLATDYNKHFWHISFNWDFYDGFYQKQWVYSVIPNMGGKTAFTGFLDYYLNGHLTALRSENKGNLVGVGMAPEGFENNEMIYEIYCETTWYDKETNMDEILERYSINRYGFFHDNIKKSWELLQKTAYGSFMDHPRFSWQEAPGKKTGSVCTDPEFEESMRFWINSSLLASDVKILNQNKLYTNDLIEACLHLVGIKLEHLQKRVIEAFDKGDNEQAAFIFIHFRSLMTQLDAVLECHTNLRLEKWLDYTDDFKENARRLITIWGPPINDYSSRMWSGMMRDYQLRRIEVWFEAKMQGKDPSQLVSDFELDWVLNSKGISKVPKSDNVIEEVVKLMKFSDSIDIDNWVFD
ncbi:alpha-N-acetylglucosaminidase [Tritrichomonas foetus]|uniref:Alpha-N-acetylglucosaminidase n=1 Tax=Tritrichomonas foetus TaxID=1144522 RepID=A0A1J4JAP5_9EUKA|nr:alpha-N-acetylglucosaminidase [Tritrichomonas foetus]|eukprot:OHS94332.1 alpha-N-acetylglucosaminidase [Tritrichomonas foetus]